VLRVHVRRFELAAPFTITRFTVSAIEPVWVEVHAFGCIGRGEANRLDYEGETSASLVQQIEAARALVQRLPAWDELRAAMPAGAARNAVAAALIDLDAKRHGVRAWQQLGLPAPEGLRTWQTIGLAAPAAMAASAAGPNARYPALKIKLGRFAQDIERLEAVRAARPEARLIVDANAGWSIHEWRLFLPHAVRLGVEAVEQPLPPGEDAALAAEPPSPLPLIADESVGDVDSLAALPAGYAAINVKLDKAGGLPEALRLARAARERGWEVMVGNMMGSSLAIAPAMLLAPLARWLDLDGPLDLLADCEHPIRYDADRMSPPEAALWG
jgi:L-alanine-DL-glutamate epimerase-like enolase superfamily enzyme